MASTRATIWPEQVKLPGQVGAPAGPLDLTLPYAVHHAMRADLDRFGTAVRTTPCEDEPVWQALAARWRLLLMAVRHEVSAEAAGLWSLVLERGEPVDRVAVHRLRHEQADALRALERCRFSFDGLAQHADPATRAQAAELHERSAQRVRGCLRLKERMVFEVVQRVLDPDEWRAVEQTHFRIGMVPDAVDFVIWLTDGLPGPLRRDLFRRLGHVEEVMWTLGRPPFRRREEIAFRYVP